MHSGSDSTTANQTAPPDVRVVVPTLDPGPWFDDVVEGLAAQDYPAMSVTFVHGRDDGAMLEGQLSDFDYIDLRDTPDSEGFGKKINAVAESSDESLLLILHDDVAMEPGTVSALVREWLRRRDEHTVVGAKLLDWSNAERLMPSGFVADRFGAVENSVNPGDLDQGQQDRVLDSFGTSTVLFMIS